MRCDAAVAACQQAPQPAVNASAPDGRTMRRMRRTVLVALSLAACAALVTIPGTASARSQPRAHAAIVGGGPAPTDSWPWTAWIDDNDGPGEDYNCTGTVVSPYLVLTAAHCAEDPPSGTIDNVANFTVVTGSLDRTSPLGQVSGVSEIIPHATEVESSPTDGVTIIGDAALLVLTTPTTAPPMTLADTSTDAALVAPGTQAYIGGWGLMDGTNLNSHPNVLQIAPTVVQSPSYCAIAKPDFDSLAEICTIDAPFDLTSTCGGDSGGPLAVQTTGAQWVEIGLTSTSGTNCNPSQPQYFTRVDYVDSWVKQWIAALPDGAPPPAPPSAPSAPTTPPAAPAPTPVPLATSVSAPSSPPSASIPAPALPRDGRYAGTSSQHRGRVDVTVGPHGITGLKLEFNLRCDRRERGPYTQADASPVPVTLEHGLWGFSTAYRNSDGWRFSVAGTFSAAGIASGRLTVRTVDSKCTSGPVDWRAAIAAS